MINHTPTLVPYFKDLYDYTLLDENEQYALASRVKIGDKIARDQMITGNLRLVVQQAKIFAKRCPSIGLEDFINEGNFGLIKAVDGFNPDQTYKEKATGKTQRVKFSSYAVKTINGYLLIYIQNNHPVHIPRDCQNKIGKVRKYVNAFSAQHNREPSTLEIQQEFQLNRSDSEHIEAQRHLQVISFYDCPAVMRNNGQRYNLNKKYWEAANAISPLTLIEIKEELVRLENAQRQIAEYVRTKATPPQVLMLTEYYGVLNIIDPSKRLTLCQLGRKVQYKQTGILHVGQRVIKKFSKQFELDVKILIRLAEIIQEGNIFLADFYKR